ncbi:sensor domain-containing protein [Halorussus litoreus]|uniref:sensor domain-containing protein n=1 Tax=Halorussus litoreus TaxID=1710536 RepID=UPI0013004D40|nr:sensor domain-containing protein [Halorussus litoreus]
MTTSIRDAATTFVGVPARTQTYRNLVYLAVAFPLGLAYFVGLTFGFSLGAGLAITVVGVPMLLATLAGSTLLTRVEAELANRLLGTSIHTRLPDASGGILDAVKRLVTDANTWIGVAYLFGKFVFGLVSFTALVSLLSAAGSMLVAPLTYSSAYYVGPHFGTLSVGPFESGRLVVNTFGRAVGVAVVGLVLALGSLHLLNALARVAGTVTEALLDVSEARDPSGDQNRSSADENECSADAGGATVDESASESESESESASDAN